MKLKKDPSKSPINNSPSKMRFSFSKTQRFPDIKVEGTPRFYNQPNRLSRSSSFGYGSKLDFTKAKVENPGPCQYRIQSLFKKKNSRGVSIGASRQKMIATSYLSKLLVKLPGPGAYNLLEKKSKRGFLFSNHSRKRIFNSEKLPGPGDYNSPPCLSSSGKYFVSKYSNSKSSVIMKSASERFFIEKIVSPGPSAYSPKTSLNNSGHYLFSKLRSAPGKSFSQAMRGQWRRELVPGPGQYLCFSEFGVIEDEIKS